MAEKLVLLDGYSLMYRAFHALSTPMTAPDGTPTNAVHGFLLMLFRILSEEEPDAVAVAFDVSAHTFRNDLFDGYKANRKPMPDELRQQDPVIRDLIRRMGIAILEVENFEADDILGTLSLECERRGVDALIVTGDRDSFQLAGDHTSILYTKRGISDTERVTPGWIQETYGVAPKQLIDVKGLMGDTSDNIPGVPGVGEKTALRLIVQYGSLEEALDRADTGEKGKLRERLIEFREQAELSKRLSEIDRAVPVRWDLDGWRIGRLDGALGRLRELGMQQSARRLSELSSAFAPADAPEQAPNGAPTDAPDTAVERFDDLRAFADACRALSKGAARFAVYIGSDFSVATETRRLAIAIGGDLLSPGVGEDEALAAALPLIESKAEQVYFNIKALGRFVDKVPADAFDALLAAYALNPQRPAFTLEALCDESGIPHLAAGPAASLLELAAMQRKQLERDELNGIYRDIERPLLNVLHDMEREGFLIDAGVLESLGHAFRTRIAELEAEISALAGETINLKSPKQLSDLLFNRLGLPKPKKTSSGYATTSAEVLEALADEHPIAAKILEYRKYQKLESTYVGALIRLRDKNGRVHSSFDQVSTATGRLSSQEPNLQNIPVRTDLGREIRAAFVARPGYLLVDADYSQIELRVLSHMSDDQVMQSAFLEGQDIHRRTAAEVYGVALGDVTPAMRSAAKAVNFGIVYGISDFTLSKNIGVSRAEARAFMERYFARYPGVKRFMDDMIALGRERGYAKTLFGRRRYLPEIKSSNYNVRAFGERCAMNSPIQGTAADIMKLAMIRVHRALAGQGLKAKLILQVHDELIVEAPENEVEAVKALLTESMEGVATLKVPLKIDLSVGRDWRACN